MKTKFLRSFFFSLFILLVLISCVQVEPQKGKMKVLILGNSIVHHGVNPSIGWYGEWGMAASSREKDFVHVLMDTLSKTYKNIEWDYLYHNITYWENNFAFDFANQDIIKDYLNYKPDILIIRLGENVKDEYAKVNDYEGALEKLIDKFKGSNSYVLLTNNFWPSEYKDIIHLKLALDKRYAFVDLSDLDKDKRNQAIMLFTHPSVAAHPSDYGMRNIASKIYERIERTGNENWNRRKMVF